MVPALVELLAQKVRNFRFFIGYYTSIYAVAGFLKIAHCVLVELRTPLSCIFGAIVGVLAGLGAQCISIDKSRRVVVFLNNHDDSSYS